MDEVFKLGILWSFLSKLLKRTSSSKLKLFMQDALFQLLYKRYKKYDQAQYGHLENFPGSTFQCPEMEVNFPGLSYKLIIFLHKDLAKAFGPG